MKSPLMVIQAVELSSEGNIIPIKGYVISKDKIKDLDELCYQQILIDLGIDKVC